MNPFAEMSRPLVSRPGDAIEMPPKRVLPAPLMLPHVDNPWKLTPVLCEVLRRVVAGESAKEIGASLGRSPKTIECHYTKIKKRMGAQSLLLAALEWDRFRRAA